MTLIRNETKRKLMAGELALQTRLEQEQATPCPGNYFALKDRPNLARTWMQIDREG